MAGRPRSTSSRARTLLDCLRENLGLKGTHAGCEHGVCGACTDPGRRRAGAILPDAGGAGRRAQAHHHRGPEPRPRRAQRAAGCVLRDARAAVRLLHARHDPRRPTRCWRARSSPTRADIVEAISGNLCRCTGYGQIVEAIALAAERLRSANLKTGEDVSMGEAAVIQVRLAQAPRARGSPLRERPGDLRQRRDAAWNPARRGPDLALRLRPHRQASMPPRRWPCRASMPSSRAASWRRPPMRC